MNLLDRIEGTASGTSTAAYVTALTLELNPYKSTTIFISNGDDTSSLTYKVVGYAKMTGTLTQDIVSATTLAQGADTDIVQIVDVPYAKALVQVIDGDGHADYVIEYTQERLQRWKSYLLHC